MAVAVVKVKFQQFTDFVADSVFSAACIHKFKQSCGRIEGSYKVVEKGNLVDDTNLAEGFGRASNVGINPHHDLRVVQVREGL